MTFEETQKEINRLFPSLIVIDGNTYSITSEGMRKMEQDIKLAIIKHCLDKAKVLEVINYISSHNGTFPKGSIFISPTKLKKELGLE